MNKIYGLLLKGVALAMGFALIITEMYGAIYSRVGFTMAGIGIFAIALESFLKYTYGLHK